MNIYADIYAVHTLNIYIECMCNVDTVQAVIMHTEFSFYNFKWFNIRLL